MLNSSTLRKAAIELYRPENLVKSAGVIQRVRNWLKALSNPQYKQQVEELKEQSENIKYLIDQLEDSLNKVQGAIKDKNVDVYYSELEKVRDFSSQLAADLTNLEQKTNTADVPAAVKQDYSQEQQPKNLPDNYDVEFSSKIGKPLLSYKWFQQYSAEDISINPAPANNLVQKLAAHIDAKTNIAKDKVITSIKNSGGSWWNALKQAILNGRLNYNLVRKEGELTQISITTSELPISNTGIAVYLTITLTHSISPIIPNKVLSLRGLASVSIASISDTAKQEKINEEDEYPHEEEGVEELGGEYEGYHDQYDANDGVTARINKFNQLMKMAGGPVEMKRTAISKEEIVNVIAKELLRRGQSPQAAPLLAALVGAETSFKSIWNYNLGNMAAGSSWTGNYWVPPWVGKDGPRKDTPRNRRLWKEWKANRAPGKFRAYESLDRAVVDLVEKMIKRFPGVLEAAKSGDPALMAKKIDTEKYCPGCDVEKYEKALRAHYDPSLMPQAPQQSNQMVAQKERAPVPTTTPDQLNQEYEQLMNQLFAAGPVDAIVKKSALQYIMPVNKFLLTINSGKDFVTKLSFAKHLSNILRTELDASALICVDKDNIEVECDIIGKKSTCSDALKETIKLANKNFNIKYSMYDDLRSNYKIASADLINSNLRKYALSRIKYG